MDPTTAHGRADGCPSCVTNVEPPQRVEETPDGVRCHYACTDCGHRWYTSWEEG